jgi:fibronectin type 3 domain-containing protein
LRTPDIVINEIMYRPISGDKDEEYVELYNRSTNAVDLGGWRFVDGISFTFPRTWLLQPGGYVVIAASAARLQTHYSNLGSGNLLGNFSGSLDNGGERLALAMPEPIVSTNTNNVVVTNFNYVVVEEVAYRDGGRWGKWSDGGGSSLESVDANSDRRRAANWADSDETARSSWTNVEYTGVLMAGDGSAPQRLEIILVGAGECLIDDVEVFPQGGANLVGNSTFDAGVSGWTLEGNHDLSGWQSNGGTGNSGCLRLRASGRGEYLGNRVRAGLTSALTAGGTATLRAKARWLRGEPELVLRLSGNYLEAVGKLPVPANLGTPGARNGQAITNNGPAIFDVSHTPILPAAGQSVFVTARIHDPDGLAAVTLQYRVDPGTARTSLNMVDNGTGADAVAGDGTYSATIPGQASGAMVAFRVTARDALGATNRFPNLGPVYPGDTLLPECLVRFGEPQPAQGPGKFGTYHLWVSSATLNRWQSRGSSHNGMLDATLVYDNQRVVYNAGVVYAGSACTMTRVGSPLDYVGYNLAFPSDDRLLGAEDVIIDWNAPGGYAQHELIGYWVAKEMDLPYNHRRFVHCYFNGTKHGSICEDAQQPNSDGVAEWFSDDTDGDLHKIEVWWTTPDQAGVTCGNYDTQPALGNFLRGNMKNLARYRITWPKRAVKGSANDFTALFALVDAMNSTGPTYTANVEAVMDVEEWMRMFAFQHVIGNSDCYSLVASHNMYAYKPQRGKWQLMPYDLDYLSAESASADLFNVYGDSQIAAMVQHPPFKRAYLRALQDAANGSLAPSNVDATLDANYYSLSSSNGLGSDELPPTNLKSYFSTRRSTILNNHINPLAGTAFAVTSPPNNSSVSQNVVMLTGTAPIGVRTIKVNGVEYSVTWTSVTQWSLTLALDSGLNMLLVQGFDRLGNLVSTASMTNRLTFTGTNALPEDSLVINEIMYNPAVPGAEFVELYNRSATTAFNLANYRFNGLDFTFPHGTLISPGGFLIIVKDRSAFGQTYGFGIPIAGEFDGSLDNGGETLSLVRPGLGGGEEMIDVVTYDDDPPWPAQADGTGPSLQLIDPTQDNNRVSNWAVAATNASPPQPEWRYVTAVGTASSSTLYVYLTSAGEVYIDDLKLVAGSVPEVGANAIANGDFEAAFPGPWLVALNHAASATSTAIKHSGNASLHLIASSGGTTRDSAVVQDMSPGLNLNQPYALSYWYLPSSNGLGLTIRLSGSGIVSSHSIAPATGPASTHFTPGAPNSVRATLPPFPALWLNELVPDNIGGPQDSAGDRDPWGELYNAGTTALDLGGYFLADNFTNLAQWAFPSNQVIGPGEFLLVWLDGEPHETTGAELHASFQIPPFDGALVLAQSWSNQPVILDYIKYGEISADYSLGFYPDGAGRQRQVFFHATPGGTNDNTPAPLPIFINEWLADNTRTLADPADNDFEDWFELYNPNVVAADLSGYFLADSLTNPTQWRIPQGTLIAPHGFLLVWADEETGQNNPGSVDLHANFKLSKGGEALALFAPNRELVDAITFGPQTTDVSQGRWPNGMPEPFYAMPQPTPRSANVIRSADQPLIRILSLTNVPGGEGNIVWTAQPGRIYRTQYKVQLEDSVWSNLPGETIAHGETAAKSIILDNGNPYRFFQIELLTDGLPDDGTSPPPRPAGVTATAGNGQITLRWIGSLGATSFNVKRGTSPGSSSTMFSVAASPFQDTTVMNGTTYYYVVSAVKGAQESPDSREVSATPLAPPAGVLAAQQSGSVTIQWQPSIGATSYKVKRGFNPGIYTTVFATSSSPYQDLSVQSGTTYYYAVCAVRGTSESTNSVEVSVSTSLLPPSGVMAMSGSNRVTLTWTPSTGATSYQVRRGTSSGIYTSSFTAGDSTYVDSTAQNATTYYYVVVALNANGESPSSTEVSVTPLAPPANVTLTPGDSQVTVSWEPSTGATGYRIKRGAVPANYTSVFSATGPPYVDSTVQSNVTYYYVVSAMKDSSESANSAEANIRLGGTGEIVWVDDRSNLPANAVFTGEGGENWNWIGSNPSPFSGIEAHQSIASSLMHQHYFYNTTDTLMIEPSDLMFGYVYLNPANPPATVMLQWHASDGSTWDHRAYWGANNSPWGIDGTGSRRRMGNLPPAGQWVRLEVPANLVNLVGQTIHGMAFTLWGGQATWDYAGKTGGPSPGNSLPATVPAPPP